MQDTVTKPAALCRLDTRVDTRVSRPRASGIPSSNRAAPSNGRRSDRGLVARELEQLVQTAILPRLLTSQALATRRVMMPGSQTAPQDSAETTFRELATRGLAQSSPVALRGGSATASVLQLNQGASARQAAVAVPAHPAATRQHVDDMVQTLLATDAALAFRFVQALQDEGLSDPTVMLDVLTPAARQLGALWDDDQCDFLEVSIGLGRLEDVVARVSAASETFLQARRQERCLLMPAPGETHQLGVAVVESFFVQAGWQCERGTVDNFATRLRREAFDLVGFSLSCTRHVEALRAAITQCREASKKPGLIVLVGGPVFLDSPNLGREIGADATAQDARAAVTLAQSLLKRSCDV